jgi:parallel beta-helix repeat protein
VIDTIKPGQAEEGTMVKLRAHALHVVLVVLAATGSVWALDDSVIGHAGVPVALSCGDTITVDTTLDADLVDCPSNGLVIGANYITLDLNGHTIDGDDALVDACPKDEFCDVGVLNEGYNGATVKGGEINEFAFGVFLQRTRGNLLKDLSASDNVLSGFLLVETARSRVRESTSFGNAGPDSGVGITLFESDHNRVLHNKLFDNAELGIHLVRSNDNRVAHNVVRRNPEDGIILEGDRNQIVHNRVVRNSITVTIFSSRAHAVGNVVRRNVVRRGPRGGIAIDRVVKRTVVMGNHVFGAGGHGILIGNATTTVTRNEARYNHDLGIKAVVGVIDGGGNRASGNGDPRQCLNISCS